MKKGILTGILAFSLWGFFPLYLRLLVDVPPLQIISHRVVWSFLLFAALVFSTGQVGALRAARRPRVVLVYLALAVLLGVNWLIFVWAVNAGHTLEASLGYFINPLVNVLLGMVFLGERLRRGQWLALGLAAGGVLYLTVSFGSPPWIALALAVTFGLYGLVKKLSPLDSVPGLALETAMMLPAAVGYLVFAEIQGTGAFLHGTPLTSLLLVGLGLVTAVPLLLFAMAARRVSLTILGLVQYFSPTIQFINGLLIFQEPFSLARAVGFVCIWLALAVYAAEGLRTAQKNRE